MRRFPVALRRHSAVRGRLCWEMSHCPLPLRKPSAGSGKRSKTVLDVLQVHDRLSQRENSPARACEAIEQYLAVFLVTRLARLLCCQFPGIVDKHSELKFVGRSIVLQYVPTESDALAPTCIGSIWRNNPGGLLQGQMTIRVASPKIGVNIVRRD
jgi:hypothetical protein